MASSKKVFENEIGDIIRGRDLSYHKCPDTPKTQKNKVDFIWCWHGWYIGTECKECHGNRFPLDHDITPNQRMFLEGVNSSDGLGFMAVNFGRIRGIGGDRGIVGLYRWPFVWKADGKTMESPGGIRLTRDGWMDHVLVPEEAEITMRPSAGTERWHLVEAIDSVYGRTY